jgi:hypothetical protein
MPRDPVQSSSRSGTFDGAAVPRDRANKRNDVREKIVVGELNIFSSMIFHIL